MGNLPPPMPLPRGWPAYAKSALLHAISVACAAIIDVRADTLVRVRLADAVALVAAALER